MFFEKTLESVIGIDTDRQIFHLYSMQNGDKNSINYIKVNFKAAPFSDEFYEKFGNILKQYREMYPQAPLQRVSLVLPDSMFLNDTVSIPTMPSRSMDSTLNVALSNLYRNSAAIKFNRFIAAQNKQQTAYGIIGLRRDVIAKLHKTCSANQVGISNISYFAATSANAAFVLNPKLKNATFALLDIKEDVARIVLVIKGKAFGYYSLPFGYSSLYKTRVVSEDLLFDHSYANLVVLNAEEKAKAKALTMASDQKSAAKAQPDEAGEDYYDDDEEREENGDGSADGEQRVGRKLPKFMIRPTPTSREGFVFENFRIFMKWTLDIIASNSAVTAFGEIKEVYVNMPHEFDFLYDMIRAEQESEMPKTEEGEADSEQNAGKEEKKKKAGFDVKKLLSFDLSKLASFDLATLFKPKKDDQKRTAKASSVDGKRKEPIRFQPLTDASGKELVVGNVDLFGGFYVKQYNKINNF